MRDIIHWRIGEFGSLVSSINWNNIESKGPFKLQNMLISRDLNFTWSTNEFWGQRDKLDPLSSFFFWFI